MKTSLVFSVYRETAVLPTPKTILATIIICQFQYVNKRRKMFTDKKSDKQECTHLLNQNKFKSSAKGSQSRYKKDKKLRRK